MRQCYVVVAIAGILTVLFDVAYQSYLPSLVERGHVLECNSKLALSSSIAEIAGPGLTGVLVQLLRAPTAILFDALSFLVSAGTVWLIRKPEHDAVSAGGLYVWEELTTGMRAVAQSPIRRAIAGHSATAGFFGGLLRIPLCAIRDKLFASESSTHGCSDRSRWSWQCDRGSIGSTVGAAIGCRRNPDWCDAGDGHCESHDSIGARISRRGCGIFGGCAGGRHLLAGLSCRRTQLATGHHARSFVGPSECSDADAISRALATRLIFRRFACRHDWHASDARVWRSGFTVV